ncbi:MAG: hypothetical protein HC871_03585 [Rhizobiales bacterium]|nr:hypothetical protein [Hyphomicrobiales bacterium]
MVIVVTVSNIAVQYPINDWWTWGAFTYPVAFLVTDLTNRALGPGAARRVVYAGFALAVVLSIWLATPRIALASGTAFLAAQLLDIAIFDRLRRASWWRAPLVSSTLSSVLDTALFFSLAFAGTGAIFLGMATLSTIVKRDLSNMAKFMFIGAILVLVAGIANFFIQSGALMITLAVLIIGIFSFFILYDLKRVRDGEETNYITATLGVYLSIYNIFQSLLALFGIGGSSE